MRIVSLFLAAVVAALIAFTVPACGPAKTAGGKPVVVCTIFAYYDVARAIAGDKAKVEIILPRGQSPHGYQTTPQNKAAVYDAQLYIKNGLGLDDRFDGLLDRSKAKKLEIGKVIDAKEILETEEVPLGPATTGDAHAGHDHEGHDHGAGNPHIWLDPRVQMAAEKIRDAMVSMSPSDATEFKANADKYLASLKELDADFAAAAKGFKTREFIGFHSAYEYLAHRYDLKQIASIEEIPGTGLTPAQTENIGKLIKEKKIKFIAIESAFSVAPLDKILKETGTQTIVLQPLETFDNDDDTYVKLMRENLEAVQKALGT